MWSVDLQILEICYTLALVRKTEEQRLEDLKKRRAALDAEVNRLQARKRVTDRKADTRRKDPPWGRCHAGDGLQARQGRSLGKTAPK